MLVFSLLLNGTHKPVLLQQTKVKKAVKFLPSFCSLPPPSPFFYPSPKYPSKCQTVVSSRLFQLSLMWVGAHYKISWPNYPKSWLPPAKRPSCKGSPNAWEKLLPFFFFFFLPALKKKGGFKNIFGQASRSRELWSGLFCVLLCGG